MLSPELLAILRCPKCRGTLSERSAPSASGAQSGTAALVCVACKLSYAVDDGIPNLLIEEAQPCAA